MLVVHLGISKTRCQLLDRLLLILGGLDGFDPGVKAMRRHAESFGDFRYKVAAINDLTDCFILEFWCLSGTAHLSISYAH